MRSPRDALPAGALTVIVPRHPQRFDASPTLLRARAMPLRAPQRQRARYRRHRVVLGDTMGEMLAYYAAADVAFVGGSLLPLGGQNLIEPIAVGVPTLVGPHTFNFADATEQAIDGRRRGRVADADALHPTVASCSRDPPRAPGDARCARSRSTPRIAARPNGCGRGSSRASMRRSPRAERAAVSP